MKYEFKISRLAIVCALCASAVCPAFGAASVRSLGGAGAYSGAASAAAAKPASGTNAARAGSMRVTTSQAKPAASTGGNSASAASTSRLSIGKYLGGGTSVSGGSSIKNQTTGGTSVSGGSMTPGSSASASDVKDLTARVENLEIRSSNLKDDVNDALGDKQDKLNAKDKYVVVDGADIYLDVDNLSQDLQDSMKGTAGEDGREVVIDADNAGIKWQYSGDGNSWKYLAAWDDLKGEKGDAGTVDAADLNKAVADAVAGAGFLTASDLTDYAKTADVASKSDVNALQTSVTDVESKLTTAQAIAAAAQTAAGEAKTAADAVNAALANYATNDRVDEIVAGNIDLTGYAKTTDIPSLDDYAKTAEVADKDSFDALATTVAGKADVSDIPTQTSQLINDSGFLTEHQSLADYAKTAEVADKDSFDTLVTTVAGKADASDIPTKTSQLTNDSGFLTEHQSLADYAKADDVYTKDEVDTKVADVVAGDMSEALTAYAQTTYVNSELEKKADAVDVPTKTSDLTNDSDFLSAPAVADMSKDQVLSVYGGQKVWLGLKDIDE